VERSDTVRISGQAARELRIGKVCAVEPEILTVSLRSTSG
jgi:hypothetical protein